MQLRYLQTLAEIATENSSTVVFPVPIDLLKGLEKVAGTIAASSAPREEKSEPKPPQPSFPKATS